MNLFSSRSALKRQSVAGDSILFELMSNSINKRMRENDDIITLHSNVVTQWKTLKVTIASVFLQLLSNWQFSSSFSQQSLEMQEADVCLIIFYCSATLILPRPDIQYKLGRLNLHFPTGVYSVSQINQLLHANWCDYIPAAKGALVHVCMHACLKVSRSVRSCKKVESFESSHQWCRCVLSCKYTHTSLQFFLRKHLHNSYIL